MSRPQLERYGRRVGQLTAKYGPHVFDTYGYANLEQHVAYAKAAAAAGGAPAAFVSQPNWVGAVAQGKAPFDPWHCPSDNLLLPEGTPLVCASGLPNLFYYSGGLDAHCPSCDLARRIEQAATKQPPPFFVLVYGGLQAFGGVENASKKSFFTLLEDTVARLEPHKYVTVGADEMARLAKEALS